MARLKSKTKSQKTSKGSEKKSKKDRDRRKEDRDSDKKKKPAKTFDAKQREVKTWMQGKSNATRLSIVRFADAKKGTAPYIDLRKMYLPKGDDELKPTGKGLMFDRKMLSPLIKALKRLEKKLDAKYGPVVEEDEDE